MFEMVRSLKDKLSCDSAHKLLLLKLMIKNVFLLSLNSCTPDKSFLNFFLPVFTKLISFASIKLDPWHG